MPIAENEYGNVVKQLKIMIKDSEYSLRRFCEKTQNLGPHEQIYHSNMSEILRNTGRYNLSVQQFLMILKMLGTTPAVFFTGSKDAAVIAEAYSKLDDHDKKQIAKSLLNKLDGSAGTTAIVRRLSRLSTG